MNLTADARMVLHQLGILADRLDHAGKTEQALRLRVLSAEIRRLVSHEFGTDDSE